MLLECFYAPAALDAENMSALRSVPLVRGLIPDTLLRRESLTQLFFPPGLGTGVCRPHAHFCYYTLAFFAPDDLFPGNY